MVPASVGTIEDAEHLQTHDLKDETQPAWPWEAFAKHDTLSGLRCEHQKFPRPHVRLTPPIPSFGSSLNTISVARTWRISAAAEPTAGGEGAVTLHCGQPVASATLLISVLPLRRRPGSEASPDEQLEHTVHLRAPLAKGSTKTLRYGPVCRAG